MKKNLLKLLFYIALSFLPLISFSQISADFTANSDSGCAYLAVTFSDLSIGNPVAWSWDFGDGNTSSFQNPSTFYSVPGSYTVTLTVTDGNGNKSTVSKTDYITILKLPGPKFSSDVTGGCVPLPVTFIDQTSQGNAGVESWLWDFGDGSFSTSQNPSHTYGSIGSYQVSLEVVDSLGCTKKKTESAYVSVQSLPSISFTTSASVSCTIPFTVNFTNTSGTSGLTYSWTFGDGNTSTQTDPSNTYTSFGTYSVYLTGTDSTGCSNSYGPVNISISPYGADFNLSAIAACLNTQITFNDQSSPSPNNWSWDFGDGNTSTSQNPSNTYTSMGTFNVTLISSTALGCADTIVKSITVYPLPVADFTVDDQTACDQPFAATFTDLTPNSAAWQWDVDVPEQSLGKDTFGLDATAQTFTHTYDSSGGIFTVKLIVTDSNGCLDTLVKFDYINNNKPYASFSADKTSGCVPLTVNFTDTSWSHENIVSRSWDFGDPASGSNNVSSLENPSHIYNDTGSFTITLSITDAGGCVKTTFLSLVAGMPPVTDFYILDTSICYGGDLEIFDSSSSYANEWAWAYAFGDDTSYIFPSKSASDFYAQNLTTIWTIDTAYFGIAHVAIFNGCAGDTVARPLYFYVNLPKAIFISSPGTFCEQEAPYTVTIDDMSEGADVYLWDFGDTASGAANISTDSVPPPHTYDSPGLYTINLKVTNDSSGCEHESSSSIFISNVNVDITLDTTPLIGCNPSSFTIQNSTTANEGLIFWGWIFGDDSIGADWYDFYNYYSEYDVVYNSYLKSPSDTIFLDPDSTFGGTYNAPYHTYNTAGLFSIRLTVASSSGCIDTLTLQDAVRIYEVPIALYEQDINTGCAPLTVNFSDTSLQGDAPIVAWNWNFGDGNTDTLQNSLNVFQTAGTYPVTLTVTDTHSCSGSITKNYEVVVTIPSPGISISNVYCFYNNITFNNTSTGSSLSYVWDFGDGSSFDSSASPTHHYDVISDTLFTVTLYAVDINGCDSAITKLVDIRRPYAGFYLTDLNNNCPPFFSTFIDTSSTVSAWYYNYGDAASNTFTSYSDADTVSHVYNSSGIYDVRLIVMDAVGCYDTLEIPDYVKVDGPLGNFDYNPKDGCAPLEVTFIPYDIYNAASFTWIFGDGSSSYEKDTITHTYNQAGSYIPVLILEDSINYTLGDSITCVLTLIPDTELFVIGPEVDFTMIGEDTSCTAYSVTFTNFTDPDSIDYWLWDFGDGSTSTDMHPTHFFSDQGSYDITLKAYVYDGNDTCVYTVSKEDLVTVFDPPQIIYSLSDIDSCPPLNIIFTVEDSTITFPASEYYWDFGDGQASSEQNTTHVYDSSGSFNVSLTVTFENGCETTYAYDSTVTIYPVPEADFNIVPEINGAKISYYLFENNSQDATNYVWDFGDGGNSLEENPQYLYDDEGTYLIKLIAINEYGCSDTAVKDQYIYLEPQFSNTFTPNGDGQNDQFVIKMTGGLDNLWLKVFDRWGKLVYEKEDYQNDWDGTDMNGTAVPPDTYYYIINHYNKIVWAGWLRIF
jgi:gliding motility-associated-like protein